MKSIFTSKTFWVAVLQGTLGAVAVFTTEYPEVGWLVVGKSVVDILLRYVTVRPVAL